MLLPRRCDRLPDLFAPLLLVLIASGFFIVSLGLELGAWGRPGPGALPLITSGVLWLLSVSLLWPPVAKQPQRSGGHVSPATMRSLGSTLGGMLMFSFTVRPLGLVVAVFLGMLAVTALDTRLTWRCKLLLAVAVSLLAWVLFILLLDMPVVAFVGIG